MSKPQTPPTAGGPTAYPDVNALLEVLLESVRAVLGDHFVGMVLDGSLTGSDFDQDSDIDFIVVTDEEVSDEQFAALQATHDRIATMDTPWAVQLEGSYISQRALRRFDPACATHPNIERDPGQRLKMAYHDEAWVVHRAVVRERGIRVAGPDPQTLIDPISPDELRRAMAATAPSLVAWLEREQRQIRTAGYQSYVVLTLCRMLYTLEHGAVVSKRTAAHWAQATLGEQWAALIERAWEGRHNSYAPASPEDISATLDFARYVLDVCRRFELPTAGAGEPGSPR